MKPGKSGADEIKAMMDNFRANPPKEIGGSPVKLIKDYKTLKMIDAQGNAVDLDMPETSNVLQYLTENQVLYRGEGRNGLPEMLRQC